MFFHIRLYDFPVSRRTAELRNQHRAYLGGFAGNLIGRGAVQSEDGSTPRGSIFFGDWADRAAVEKFMAEEPFNRNGVYMSAEIVRAMKSPAFLEKLEAQAMVPVYDTPAAFAVSLKKERDMWAAFIQRNKVVLD